MQEKDPTNSTIETGYTNVHEVVRVRFGGSSGDDAGDREPLNPTPQNDSGAVELTTPQTEETA